MCLRHRPIRQPTQLRSATTTSRATVQSCLLTIRPTVCLLLQDHSTTTQPHLPFQPSQEATEVIMVMEEQRSRRRLRQQQLQRQQPVTTHTHTHIMPTGSPTPRALTRSRPRWALLVQRHPCYQWPPHCRRRRVSRRSYLSASRCTAPRAAVDSMPSTQLLNSNPTRHTIIINNSINNSHRSHPMPHSEMWKIIGNRIL